MDDAVLAAVRGNPGQWARVKHYSSRSGASSARAQIRRGKVPELPAGEWEVESRTNGTGSYLYLRYLGKGTK